LADPETTEAPDFPVYVDIGTAPYVYFDRVAAHGVMKGAIQIELASRILIPLPDGGVEVKFVTSGRLRCSPAAAAQLRDGVIAALKMFEETTQESPAATSKLN
jgi:hypothetical protein